MMWWFAVAMMVVALVIVLWPLLRSRPQVTLDSNTANVAVLKEQLQELESDYASGNIPEEQYDKARIDLEAAVAADLVESGEEAVHSLSIKTRRLLGMTLIVALPLTSIALYREVTTYEEMPAEQRAMQQSVAEQVRTEMPSIDSMVEQLAEKLRQDPNNPEGWRMLGKSYLVLDRIPEAVKAYARAYELYGDTNAELLADYAEVLAYSNDNSMDGLPGELVNKALQLDPSQPKALWLAGFSAMQDSQPAVAVGHWQKLAGLPNITEQTRQMALEHIAKVRGIGGPSAESPQVADAEQPVSGDASASSGTVSVEVQVALDEKLRGDVGSHEVVYVFAKASQGMPMPLAVKRLTVADLPTTVVLDDSMAMMKGNNMSSHDMVIVGARVSRAGTPMPQPGDLEGLGNAINPREITSQKIVINQVVN